MNAALPGKLASYIHETGLRALDHLAAEMPEAEEGAAPYALQTLVGHWRTMTAEEKEAFVDRVAAAVGEVIAASALLPVGIKAGKRAVKSARKVLKKSAKTLAKNTKKAKKAAKRNDDALKTAGAKKTKSAKKKKG